MKKIKLCILLLIAFSCSNQEEIINEEPLSENAFPVNLKRNTNRIIQTPKYSTNELIVQYKNNVTPSQKAQIRAEIEGIVSYEECNCTDKSIEKWTFADNIDIEGKMRTRDEEGGGVESGIKNMDYEFSFEEETIVNSNIRIVNNSVNYTSLINPNSYGVVTIGVLDTGMNVNYSNFSDEFLHYAGGYYEYSGSNNTLTDQISGWDYVNEDDNPNDDHGELHGTKVTYIIHKTLYENNIEHKVLPIKVANSNGSISAFDLICGLKNAAAQSHIINMSLGYYSKEERKSTIMEDIIADNPNVLFVTSAGNSSINNDEAEYDHYPSSYSQQNIIAVAAANTEGYRKASFSNYGPNSVDFYAIGENIPFYHDSHEYIISGTSYAAPYITAIAAKIIHNSNMSYTPSQTIQYLYQVGVEIPENSNLVSSGKIIR